MPRSLHDTSIIRLPKQDPSNGDDSRHDNEEKRNFTVGVPSLPQTRHLMTAERQN